MSTIFLVPLTTFLPQMRIGIDLDNTLICYDDAFAVCGRELCLVPDDWSGTKNQMKRHLALNSAGDQNWQRLQGQVYGRGISFAKLFPGVFRFLWRCKFFGATVEIVSHKTKFGHKDEQAIPLREAAKNFLLDAGILSKDQEPLVGELRFCTTREEKLDYLSRKRFDWVIDDLPGIVCSEKLPDVTQGLGFDPDGTTDFSNAIRVSSWGEIDEIIFGSWSIAEYRALAGVLCDEKILDVSMIPGRANTVVARVQMGNGREGALKIYAEDNQIHDRMSAEYRGIEILREYGEKCIPECIGCNAKLGIGMYGWVDGSKIKKPTTDAVSYALEFLKRVHGSRFEQEFRSFPAASAAVFSGHDLELQYYSRLSSLEHYAVESATLRKFLCDDLKPVAESLIKACKKRFWSSDEYRRSIPLEDRTLNPSDFGFHNALQHEDGSLTFLDFEYFGWDDPAKLIGDFLFHPGMKLSEEMRLEWLCGASDIFGPQAITRLRVIGAVLGLLWCLILLNEFRTDYSIRRRRAIGSNSRIRESKYAGQLEKSKTLLSRLKDGSWENMLGDLSRDR
jgi:hypothetical protein